MSMVVGCKQADSKSDQELDYGLYVLPDSAVLDDAILLWQDSTISRIKKFESNNTSVWTVTERRYHWMSDTLIRERVDLMYISGAEDNRSRLTAEAVLTSSQNTSEALWNFSEIADRGEEWSGFYRTTEDGCCGTAPLYRLHRWSDGKQIMVHNFGVEEFNLSAPSMRSWKDRRFVGVLCDIPDDQLGVPEDSLLLAKVYYASLDSLLQSVNIRVTDRSVFSRHYYWPDTVYVSDLDNILETVRSHPDSFRVTLNNPLVKPAGADQSIVIGTFQDGHVIVIPIKNDELLLERTRFSDYEIIRIN